MCFIMREPDKVPFDIKSALKFPKPKVKSAFIDFSNCRKSTIKLPKKNDLSFHVEIDDIDF